MLPRPLLSITITPKTVDHADQLARALERLTAEDSLLRILSDTTASEVELAGVSEEQLCATIDRLRECGIEAALSRPKVLYREAITRPADGEAKHAKQTAERGEYAHVKVSIYPAAEGTGVVIENHLSGQIPDQFIASVERGIADSLARGVLAGYPMEDVRVEVWDGSYHDVDSTDATFRIAASLAVHLAASKASPILLEPVMRVEVTVPLAFEADVAGNLRSRRGEIHTREANGGMCSMRAIVPLAELVGFGTDFRRRTLARGFWKCEYDSFVPCRTANDDDDPDSNVREPRPSSPSPGHLRIALPEPND